VLVRVRLAGVELWRKLHSPLAFSTLVGGAVRVTAALVDLGQKVLGIVGV
jgi:hypothetical protein